jgi:hypothetical protein
MQSTPTRSETMTLTISLDTVLLFIIAVLLFIIVVWGTNAV